MKLTPATGTARHARPLLQALAPGQSITIALPEVRFWAKEAANAVTGARHGTCLASAVTP